MRTHYYYSIWSDNNRKFGIPTKCTRAFPNISFPDIKFNLDGTLAVAKRFVECMNGAISDREHLSREDMSMVAIYQEACKLFRKKYGED